MKISEDRKRLIIASIITFFYVGWILVNVTFSAGRIYVFLTGMSILLLALWNYIPKKKETKIFGLERDWLNDFIVGSVIGFGILLMFKIFPSVRMVVPSVPLATSHQYLVAGITAPIVEEIFFRSIMLTFLLSMGLSFFWSAIISSATFSVYHIKAYAGEIALAPLLSVNGAFIAAFFVGLGAAYLVKWRGSISVAWGLHSIINLGLLAMAVIFV